jgi:methionyl-tRNA formyltransferase
LHPDFLFSFYYRHMLKPELLAAASRGAFNMHGSILPKYRGRAPVNWAILHGERETGATLHEMTAKPDAGRIVEQQAVPILPNDTAQEVMGKVAAAAEAVLDRALPPLIAGTAVLKPQNLAAGSYFGGRRPADGLIDWTASASRIHDLVRAVAPPYPGAFCSVAGRNVKIKRTFNADERSPVVGKPALFAQDHALYLRCVDGGLLKVLEAEVNGAPLRADSLQKQFGSDTVALHNEMEKK